MPAVLKLRPVDPDDEPFLRDLRGQVDVERLGLQFWSPENAELAQKVVNLQFHAHATHYQKIKSNWDTKDCIIELDGKPAGRFIVSQDGTTVCLADIAVHRDHRGKGLGQAVIDATKAECVQSKRILRLHVEPMNPAFQIYLHLGFRVVEQSPTHIRMEWAPPTMPAKGMIFSPRG
jgi:GNAT superfamily N-acetyltransferase